MTGRRGRVLVVDDEPFVAQALALFLSDEQEVTVVNDARVALERLLAGDRYDVILCDVMMPSMSGVDLHRELTTRAPEDAARVVFITGGAFTAEARAYLDAVPNECVDKPPDGPAFRSLVRRCVAEGRARSRAE